MNIYSIGILEKNEKILFLLRKNTKIFNGYYGLVGGKIEENESPAATLVRETYEEIGLIITKDNVNFSHCLSFKNESHVTVLALVFKIIHWDGEPVNKEPDKCVELAWFSLDNLPENIIPRHKLIMEKIKDSVYSETGW